MVEFTLPSTGLGVVISKGCVIREVTPTCPFASQVQIADRYSFKFDDCMRYSSRRFIVVLLISHRLLEVNGHNVTSATPVELKKCLQESPELVKIVIGRPSVTEEEQSEKKLHEANEALEEQVEAQKKEVKKWRELYEQ